MTTFHSILNTRWYCDVIFYVESCGECTFIAGFFAGRTFKELT